MIIHIQSVTAKSTASGQAYKIVEANEGKYSFWAVTNQVPAPGYELAVAGATVDVETVQKGKFSNIVSAKPAQGQPTAPANGHAAQTGPADYQLIERASYEAQTAYKGVIELAIAGKVPADRMNVLLHALDWADAKLNSSLQTNNGDVPF